MESIPTETSIETLHAEYIISGETYLFCVDNDLQTLQNVTDCFANGVVVCSARVQSEIESILKLYSPQPSTLDEENQPSDGQHHAENREEAYLRLKGLCSVRTKNALNYLESWLGYPGDAFWAFFLDKGSRMCNFKRIRNVGKKTVSELLDLTDKLEEILDVRVIPDPTHKDPVSDPSTDDKQFDLFEFAVGQEMKQLSARPKNVLLSLLDQCGNSIVELYKALHEPGFEILKIKNIGKGSISELQEFIKRMGDLWDIHQSTEGRAMQAASVRIKALQKNFGLTELEAKTIVDAFPDAHTPPLFKIIDTTIRRSDRDWEIISGSLNIFQNQTLADRRTVAGKTNLSPERVRQLRNKIYSELCEAIRLWELNKNEFDYGHYLDDCRMEYNDFQIERLNREEGVSFNSNFIYRVLSLFFPECYTIIGDDISALMEPHKKGSNLSIVPVELSQIFDFSDFVNDLTSRINSKVYEKYAIDLKEYLLRFFKDDIHFDKMPTLLKLCGLIIHRNFGIVTIDNSVTIEKNASKTIPEILEEILSEKGEAMSLDEIFEQFKARFPDYSKDKSSFRGNLGNSSNIVPVSRTSNYVLKDWEKEGIKGGTIRDIIFDFLVDHDTPLPIDEITSHVLLFREGTNANSIYSNMFADNTKRFSAYEHDGARLYGLTQKAYGDKYELIEEERTGSKRGFKESIKLLERFITENGRFPFSSGDDPDGMRLNRFWGLHKSRREKGELSSEQFLEMKRIEELYGDRELSKTDYIAKTQLEIDKMRMILIENDIDPDAEDETNMKNLNEMDFKYRYSTGGENDPVGFFTEALSNSISFDLGLGFFSSASINVLSIGFAHFIANGGNMRLYVNQFLSEADYDAFTTANWEALPEKMVSDFREMCKILSKRDRHFFNCLSFLIAQKRITIKVVVPKGGGIAHQKFGVFTDSNANKISFTGSLNFTANALLKNIETIECDYSWKSEISKQKIEETEQDFEAIFTGQREKVAVFEVRELERAIMEQFPSIEIERLLKDEQSLVEEFLQNQTTSAEEQKDDKPHFPFPTGPREYQQDAYKAWVDNDYCGIFAMATGTGKTITSLNCVLEESKKNVGKYKVLILVPILDLVTQWVEEVEKFNFTNIYTVSGVSNWREDLTKLKNDQEWGIESNYFIISTYDSFTNPVFQKILDTLYPGMILIADEAHNVGSASVRAAFDHLKISKRIALSATPKRNYDVEGTTAIEKYFNDSPPYCYSFSMRRAIEEGSLMKYLYYPRLVFLDAEEMDRYVSLTKQLLRHFDAKIGQFAKTPEVERLLMQRKRIIHKAKDKYRVYETILDELNNLGKVQYCFVYVPEGFSESDDDGRIIEIMSRLTHEKYPNISTNTYVGGEKGKKEKLHGFADGRIDMLFAMKCLDEGVDVPRAEIGIFASSTGNPRQFIQRRGRLLRKHEDKRFAKIYDMIVVPDFRSESYDREYYEMEQSQVRAELMRVSYFASLASNYNEAREQLLDVLNFYNFEISTLIKELDEQ